MATRTFGGLFKWFGDRMMSGGMLSLGARIDAALKVALLEKMRPLSNRRKASLFAGYGPLSSFSAKIDLAFALSIFDEDLYSDLKIIKEVRNVFAHPAVPLFEFVTFEDEQLIKICKKFRDYDPTIHCVDYFSRKAAQCLMRLSRDEEEIKSIEKLLSISPRPIERAP
jgi:hypothetical protein